MRLPERGELQTYADGGRNECDCLSAVSCKHMRVCGGVRRTCGICPKHVALPQQHAECHEVVRADWASRFSSAAEVLRSAQQVPFLAQLVRFLRERVDAREDIRRHRGFCEPRARQAAFPPNANDPHESIATRPGACSRATDTASSKCAHRMTGGDRGATLSLTTKARAMRTRGLQRRPRAEQLATQRRARSARTPATAAGGVRAARRGRSAGNWARCQVSKHNQAQLRALPRRLAHRLLARGGAHGGAGGGRAVCQRPPVHAEPRRAPGSASQRRRPL